MHAGADCSSQLAAADRPWGLSRGDAHVTADTGDGIKIPGKTSGAICLGSGGSITALKSPKST